MIVWIICTWLLVLVVAFVVADDPAAGERIAAPAALLAMPITVRGHALIASSAIRVELIVPGPAAVLTPPVGLPLVSDVPVVLRIQVTAVALVRRWAHTAKLAKGAR